MATNKCDGIMKSAALLMSVGGGVVAVAVGVFVFADQLGLGNKAAPEKTAVTQGVSPTKAPAKVPDPTKPKAGETSVAQSEAKKPETAPDKEQVTEPVKENAPDPQSTTAEPSASAPEKATEADAKPEVTGPSFDVVRVEPNGETLVAGKASPGWKVELKNGEKVLAKAVADANGDWVMVLEKALDKGVSDLSLSGTSKDGTSSIASTSNVTVALPEDGSGEVLVVETAPGQASKILAKLGAPKTEAPKVEDPAGSEQQVAAVTPKQPAAPSEAANSQPDAPVAENRDSADPASAVEEAKAPAEAVTQETDKPAAGKPIAETKPETPAAQMIKQEAKSAEQSKDEKPEPASVNHLVSIEAVEIEGDVLFIAGAAEPAGSIVRLYVDNRAVSDQRSGETGRYLFDGKLKLDAGEHKARVDLLDAKRGTVAKRAEVVFTKKAPVPAGSEGDSSVVTDAKPVSEEQSAPAPTSETPPASSLPVKTKKVIIRRGDNLWEIARRVYGAGIRYSTIYDTNIKQIRNPNLIYPGQVFELPEGEDGWERNFDAVESPPEESADAAATPANGG